MGTIGPWPLTGSRLGTGWPEVPSPAPATNTLTLVRSLFLSGPQFLCYKIVAGIRGMVSFCSTSVFEEAPRELLDVTLLL